MMRDDPFSEISKLRDEVIQIAIWENPNYEIQPNLVKVKKSKLRDGMKKDGKYPNCEMEFGIIESLNFILEYKGLNTVLQNSLSSSEKSFSKFLSNFWAVLGPKFYVLRKPSL